ncbi:MAG: MaoC family dehydratase [Alphaproteobacteria bacterium]|nr:MaoC family dehydratase [Alphaproteobacteria bacterium]
MTDRYFEDFKPGDTFTTGGVTLTEAAILDFALTYDPQPFHLDVTAAKAGPFGGLIASGFHTLAVGFRQVLDLGVLRGGSMGSPGIDELRWTRPVRPGDTLRVKGEVMETKASSSKPDRGTVRIRYAFVTQADETVLTMSAIHILKRRPA